MRKGSSSLTSIPGLSSTNRRTDTGEMHHVKLPCLWSSVVLFSPPNELNDCPVPDQVQYLILLSCCQVQYLILFVLLNLPFFGLKKAFPSSLNPALPCIPWLNWMEGCCGANLSGQKNSVAFRLGTHSSLGHRDNASDPSWRKQTSEFRRVVREGWAWRSL